MSLILSAIGKRFNTPFTLARETVTKVDGVQKKSFVANAVVYYGAHQPIQSTTAFFSDRDQVVATDLVLCAPNVPVLERDRLTIKGRVYTVHRVIRYDTHYEIEMIDL